MAANKASQIEQNGRRPSLTVQSIAPLDQRLGNSNIRVGRDNVWRISAPPPPPPPQHIYTVLPPPPPPLKESSPVVDSFSALYTVRPLQNSPIAAFPRSQPPLPMFDISRPPPFLPANLRNPAIKRSIADACEAGLSKLRKCDDTSLADKMCQNCVQRELSSKRWMEKIKTLDKEMEYKTLLLKHKIGETENLKSFTRFRLPTELNLELEQFMDGMSKRSFDLSTSAPYDISKVQIQLMLHRLLGGDRISSLNNVMDSIKSSPSIEQLFLECLLNSTVSTERSPTTESRSRDILSSSAGITRSATSMASNDLIRFLNGQQIGSNLPPVAPPPIHRDMYPGTSSSGPRAYTSAGVAGAGAGPVGGAYPAPPTRPSPYTPPAHHAPPPVHPGPSTSYAVYQPAVPPPTHRPCYTYLPTCVEGPPVTAAPYCASMPSKGWPHPPATAACPAPPVPPTPAGPYNEHTYNPYTMPGYTFPHYYHPYK